MNRIQEIIHTLRNGEFRDYCAEKVRRLRLRRRLMRRAEPLRYLFVLCPMRSGSSLLGHILTSNPAVGGYGEQHVSYTKEAALWKMVCRMTRADTGLDIRRVQYLMDKLAKNYPVSEEVLRREDTRYIFLLRDPSAQFNSAVRLGEVDSWHKRWADPAVWMDYFRERMKTLAQTAVVVNDRRRCLFLMYEDLLENTETVLRALQTFLETSEPFSENYTTRKQTGDLHYGDPSANLKSGKIQKKPDVPFAHTLPPDLAEEACRIQEECLQTLSRLCQKVG